MDPKNETPNEINVLSSLICVICEHRIVPNRAQLLPTVVLYSTHDELHAKGELFMCKT